MVRGGRVFADVTNVGDGRGSTGGAKWASRNAQADAAAEVVASAPAASRDDRRCPKDHPQPQERQASKEHPHPQRRQRKKRCAAEAPPLAQAGDKPPPVPPGVDQITWDERRTDPMLDGRPVTYLEMCHSLADQQLSQAQLRSHWENLQPAKAAACSASQNLTKHGAPLRTHLGALLEGMRHTASAAPDDQVEIVLGELADSLFQCSHIESQRHLPAVEHLMTRLRVNNVARDSILDWLLRSCDIMRLQDQVLFSTVLTFDRYCATEKDPLAAESMQTVLMAVISTVLKTNTISSEIHMPLRELLMHLCRPQVSFDAIMVMERHVLHTLQFSGLCAPTPLYFLDAFCQMLLLAFREAMETILPNTPRCLANFLLQLSLFKPGLHYRHPHAILAAAGVYVALCSMRLPHVCHHALLHDVAAVCPEIRDVDARVASCASELHMLWCEFAATQGDMVPCLLRKFAGSQLHASVLLSPPVSLIIVPSPCPTRAPNVTAYGNPSSLGGS